MNADFTAEGAEGAEIEDDESMNRVFAPQLCLFFSALSAPSAVKSAFHTP